MKKRKLNVRLLRKIQKYIRQEPRRFFMADFVAKYDKNNPEMWDYKVRFNKDLSKIPPPCGTAACIAGTANLLTGGRDLNDADRAAKLIGVRSFWDDNEHHLLFQVRGWPVKYRKAYRKAKTPKTRAKIACDRINYLIETGQ